MTAGGAREALTAVRRASRDAVFAGVAEDLQHAARLVGEAAGGIGGGSFGQLRPGWDPAASASPSALLLHDGLIPLTHAGLGSRRLVSIAAQEYATAWGNILLVDEIEHGLEPHRLQHVLHQLRARSGDRRGQVILTTHSPVAVQALAAIDICVVRSVQGTTCVTPVPAEINGTAQAALRAGPQAILARKVIVGEGATEAGILRVTLRHWDDERIRQGHATSAALGVAFLNGSGGSAVPRAMIFHELGVAAALLLDNDDFAIDGHVSKAQAAGIVVARWERGNSTERQVIARLNTFDLIAEIVALGIENKGEDAVRAHLRAELPKMAVAVDLAAPQTWQSHGYTFDEIQSAVINAASGGSKSDKDKKAWFKREDYGEGLGAFILRHWDLYRGTAIESELLKLRRFIFGEEKDDQPEI